MSLPVTWAFTLSNRSFLRAEYLAPTFVEYFNGHSKKFSGRQIFHPSRVPPILEDSSLPLSVIYMAHVNTLYNCLCSVQLRSSRAWHSSPRRNLNALTNCRNSQYVSMGLSISFHHFTVYFRLANCQSILKMTCNRDLDLLILWHSNVALYSCWSSHLDRGRNQWLFDCHSIVRQFFDLHNIHLVWMSAKRFIWIFWCLLHVIS